MLPFPGQDRLPICPIPQPVLQYPSLWDGDSDRDWKRPITADGQRFNLFFGPTGLSFGQIGLRFG